MTASGGEYPKLSEAVNIIRELRHPTKGCPWDLKQTHQSLLKFLIEECYEFIDAVEDPQKGDHQMEDELGDILLQILLHTAIGEERGSFTMESVAANLSEKIIRRHPHVFGELKESEIEADQVVDNWQKIKQKERQDKGDKNPTLFGQEDLILPPLMSAMEIGKKSKKIAFDWDNAAQVCQVVEGEWQELQEEINQDSPNIEKISEELGDHLFSIVQLARHLKVDPEVALRQANRKFVRRFVAMDSLIKDAGVEISTLNQAQMDLYWDRIKEDEKKCQKN
jgi:MazG family protein